MRRSYWIFGILVVALLIFTAILYDPAARVQGWIGNQPFFAGRSATAWEKDLASKDDGVRGGAVKALSEAKGDAIPVCVWVLQNSSSVTSRFSAANALGSMGKDAKPAAEALVAALADPDGAVREVTIIAVTKLGPDAPGAVPALVKLFPKDLAIRAVAEHKEKAADAVPPLVELLKHEDPHIRWNAARTLGKIGEPALAAVPGLLIQLEDKEPLVREHAAEALGDIGPRVALNPKVVPALAKALKDPDKKVRRDSVRALGQIGAAAKPVLADVKTCQNDPEGIVKTAAENAVKAIEASQ